MLSILIPTYNYRISALVHELHKQLLASEINFEIISLDDLSNDYYEENKTLENLSHIQILKSTANNGREKTRQLLAELAKYNSLLFMDADTLPIQSNFISNYLIHINSGVKAIFGGVAYTSEQPSEEYVLRWKYGLSKEQVSAKKRNKNPYKSIVSANFLMEKEIFIDINSNIKKNGYGFDSYFASLLRLKNIKVIHIDNNVYHLGLEKNLIYLRKSEDALKTYHALLREGKISKKDNSLICLFIFLKKSRLAFILSNFFKILCPTIKKNLLSKNASIFLFQLYRILYLCNYDFRYTKKLTI